KCVEAVCRMGSCFCVLRGREERRETQIFSVTAPGDDTYTALNYMTMSPDYDTLK
ncbi:sialoadhesin-like isoform X1, partial [Clarias magur]